MTLVFDLDSLETLAAQCDDALLKLNALEKRLKTAETDIAQKLAVIGRNEALPRFSEAEMYYSGENNGVTVTVQTTGNGANLVAMGDNVAFLEFGTGVYYNSGDPYPGERPPGVVGIGMYGIGYGKHKAWGYYATPGDKKSLVITHGNPASAAMYHAKVKMEESAVKTAKEVIKLD